MTDPFQLPAILVTDDESDDLYLIEHRLQKAGVKNPIAKFRDGEELITFLESRTPGEDFRACLLLLDLKMPLVDGVDVLSWLRKHPAWSRLPVAVITSSPASRDGDRARAAGADEYHEKFPSPEDFSAMVARASAHPFSQR